MRRPFPDRIERGRVLTGKYASPSGEDYGKFFLVRDRITLQIIASAGCNEIPWEHASVSTHYRCPTWEEMCWVKEQFWSDEETVIQYHPRRIDYVNYHPFCLHLWRPWPSAGVLPTPPPIAVGPQ